MVIIIIIIMVIIIIIIMVIIIIIIMAIIIIIIMVIIIIIIIMVIIIDNIIAQGGEQVRLQDWRRDRPGLPEKSAGVRIFFYLVQS